ncbi:hypothetical protein B0O99DRAFT_615446 [Bisporella sp. PMI_857]|nr:hypothetical protein B0O99DRAFT_615446 [Bisporella sp. PMI_857]
METATIVTLVIAILSAFISIFTAFIPTWLNQLYTEWAATAKSNADLNTHKEPVVIAAIHLAHELYDFLDFLDYGGKKRTYDKHNRKRYHYPTAYLCYLFAIFFARVDALKNGVQLLNLGKSNADLVGPLCRIERTLFEEKPERGDEQYVLLRRDDIQAMIEAVAPKLNSNGCENKDKTQGVDLMGYGTFLSLLQIYNIPFQQEPDTDHEEPGRSEYLGQPIIYRNYSKWFNPLLDKFKEISQDTPTNQEGRDFRLRELQHCLINLIKRLDPDGKRVVIGKKEGSNDIIPIKPSEGCRCGYACQIWGDGADDGDV